MDNPRDDTPTKAYKTSGTFTIAAVSADDDVKGMEAGFTTVHIKLKEKTRELEDHEEIQVQLEAQLMNADRGLDVRVRSWELTILDLVNKKRNDARYMRHVPEGLRAITEAEPRVVEPAIVRRMLKTMNEDKDVPELKPLIDKHAPLFQAAVAKVLTIDQALTANEDATDRLDDVTIPDLKRSWVAERKALHGMLTTKFPTDPARVESYFKNFGRPRRKKKDASATEPPAAAPSPEPKKDG